MILARKFIMAQDDDYEGLAAASGRLRALLDAFVEDRLPPEYGPEQLAGYARSLLAVQRSDGSVSAYARPEQLEDDVRTDAHRFVTWAALAFLHSFRTRHREAAASVDGLDDGIRRALVSPLVSDLGFPESGDAEAVQQVEALLVLASGGIPALLRDDPEAAPELSAAVADIRRMFRRRLEDGETLLPGGIDYAPLYRQVLAALES